MTKISIIRAICNKLPGDENAELRDAFLGMVGHSQGIMDYFQKEERWIYDILKTENRPMRCSEISLITNWLTPQRVRAILTRLMEDGLVERTENGAETITVLGRRGKEKTIESPIAYFSVKA